MNGYFLVMIFLLDGFLLLHSVFFKVFNFIFACICICMHGYVCVLCARLGESVYMCLFACDSQRSASGVIPKLPLSSNFGNNLSLAWNSPVACVGWLVNPKDPSVSAFLEVGQYAGTAMPGFIYKC